MSRIRCDEETNNGSKIGYEGRSSAMVASACHSLLAGSRASDGSSRGGDPTRVALGGQSAGAQDTAANVLSPLSKGLFNRAIVESTPGFTTFVAPAAVAATNGINFAAAAGCPGTKAAAAACLRKLSAARILQLSATGAANSPYVTGLIVDGSVIP